MRAGDNELGKRRGSAKQYAMYDALYAHFKQLGGPISFQMAAPKNGFTGTQAGYLATLRKGVALGAGSVELYPGQLRLAGPTSGRRSPRDEWPGRAAIRGGSGDRQVVRRPAAAG